MLDQLTREMDAILYGMRPERPAAKQEPDVLTLIFSGEQLMRMAYAMLAGDLLESSVARHRGHPDRVDQTGLTKAEVYRRALAGDIVWFKKLARQMRRDRSYLRADRVFKKKESGGRRPIDMPGEAKRLHAALAFIVLIRLVQKKKVLSPRIIGYRRLEDLPKYCSGSGTTIQDMFAAAVLRGIRSVGPHVVLVDLANAYGSVPHRAIHLVLKELGLNRDARRRVLDLCRINSITKGGRIVRSRGVGIEQGNVLSALLMNLVMNRIIKALNMQGHWMSVYGDDVGLVGGSQAGAEVTFTAFKEEAEGLGFKIPGLGSTSRKAPSIYDVRTHPVPLIKTYMVGTDWIGLTEPKLKALRAELLHPTSARLIREKARCRCLSKKWMRKEGLLEARHQDFSTNTISLEPVCQEGGSLLGDL